MSSPWTRERSINRFGLTEVFTPAGGSEVDVVFVHGINGHPYTTWTSAKGKVFWPAQLLPPLVEEAKARVMVYGYDADTGSPTGDILPPNRALDVDDQPRCGTPYDGVGQDKIHNHAEHLVATLCANRRSRHATDHPIVFVAHSLGGIVVKRALIHSSRIRGKKTEHLRSVSSSTHGILFLGTPHFGYEITKWKTWSDMISCVTLGGSRSQSRLVEALKPDSETLQVVDRDFVDLTSDFHIFYFHEMKPSRLDNDWRYIVDEASAAPVIQDVERAGIQQDHVHMCTFEDDSTPGFVLVTEAIQRYAAEAPEFIRRRRVTDPDEKQVKLVAGVTSGLAATSISTSAGHALDSKPQSKHYYLVPRDRVKDFVGREAQLDEISAHFSRPSTQQPRVLVLHALGGQGKTQIVLEYCQRWRMHYRGVFWADASSEVLALQSYTRIATALSEESQAKIEDGEMAIGMVKAYLEDWYEPWLLIFDNYDKPDEFTRVKRFLPQSDQGHVIFTSRHRDLGRLGTTIELPGLGLDEGVQLLLRHYSSQEIDSNRGTAREIVRRLGCLALAIDQAAAYIAYKQILPCRLEEFITLYDLQRKKILSYVPHKFWEYGSIEMHGREDQIKAINAFTTWEISLGQLMRDNPKERNAVTRFLTLSAFFNPARIEESLFRNHWENTEYWEDNKHWNNDPPKKKRLRNVFKRWKSKEPRNSNVPTHHTQIAWLSAIGTRRDDVDVTGIPPSLKPDDQWDADRFWEVLQSVHRLSLVQTIEKDTNGATFSLHPLVRDWLQHRVQAVDHQQNIKESFDILESSAFCYFENPTRIGVSEKNALVSHIDACMLADTQLSESQNQLGSEKRSYETASNLASYYYEQGHLESAESLERRIIKNEDTDIRYFARYCYSLLALGRNDEVVRLSSHRRQFCEETLDERDPHQLTLMACLSLALRELGRYDEAESMQRQTLQLRTEVLGENHWDTLVSMSDLATLLYERGKFMESEALARETLKICEIALEKNHVITLVAMDALTLALKGQSRFNEAQEIQRQVLHSSQHLYGMEHPITLVSIKNLAQILESTDMDEAEKLYRDVIQSMKKALRKGHPHTLNSMGCLARLLREDGKDDEADEIEREILELEEAAA
ncbi:MAG: hypothetical protein Q9213_002221 [Squamulea squamosa]